MSEQLKNECEAMARNIAQEIVRIVDGGVYYDNDGNLEDMPDDGEEHEAATLFDWVNRQLGDIRYEIDQSGNVVGGKVLCSFGGPNIWACYDAIRAYWGTERAEVELPSRAADAMLDMFRELRGE